MMEHLEQQKSLTTNQWKIFAAATIGDMLDFFDFYLIGFILAFIVRGWHLTYGQSGTILLSSGIAAPLGSLFWGWMADKIGRRKVMILTVLNFSIPTGLMALTPDQGWLFLSACRFFVGMGVTGLYTVDVLIVQEFVPASKRGRITGLTTSLLPAGTLLGALSGAYLAHYVGWRGLFAVGLLPAGLTLLIRAWVPESPHWLIGKGRLEEARQSLAWALQVDAKAIELPRAGLAVDRVSWVELFKYPRSLAVSCLTGLSQTGQVGLTLWVATLFVLVLKVTPAEASFLVIWMGVAGIVGRFFSAWISDAIGRRRSVVLTCSIGALGMSLAGYLSGVYIGAVSMFYVMILVQQFSWQVHRPGRAGGDCRIVQHGQPEGDPRRADPGDELLRFLVRRCGVGDLVHRLRDARPHDPGNRQRSNRPGADQSAGSVRSRRTPEAFVRGGVSGCGATARAAPLRLASNPRLPSPSQRYALGPSLSRKGRGR
jgi:MFS transporter, putative metabolite:H+ symporter